MDLIPVIINSLFAPLPYLILGACLLSLVKAKSTTYWLSPLLGFCVYGIVGEISLFTKLPMPTLTIGVLFLSTILFLVKRAYKNLPVNFVFWLCTLYFVTLCWNAMVPYPGMGPWSGDWQENVRMGEAVWSGVYPDDLLQRTPVYGGATAPLLLLQNSLVSFQIASAVCSAAVLLVFFFGASVLNRKMPSWTGLLIILLSPFYSHNAVYLWPKQMAAGCLFTSFLFAWQNREKYAFHLSFASALWFALSVSSHQSSIFYLPVWAVLTHSKKREMSFLIKDVGLLGVLGIALCAPFEAWVIHNYGLDVRIKQNPSVYYGVDRSGYGEVRLLLVNSMAALTGWLPYSLPLYLEQHAPGWGIVSIATKIYLTLGVWATSMASTFLGLIMPFVFALGPFWKRAKVVVEIKPILWASAFAFILINLVQASPTGWGVTQTGFVGMCLGILFFLVTEEWGEQKEMSCLKYTVLLGTIPTLLSQTLVLFFLKLPIEKLSAFQKMISNSEYDARYFFQQGMSSLGLNFFAYSLVLTLGTILILAKIKKEGKFPSGV